MGKNVITIPATISKTTAVPLGETRKRRVAAYARVSTDKDDQLTSYEAQVDYYTKYIKGRSDWEFAGMFADEGKSGVSYKSRDGFKSMIEKALNGGIDLIVTKSVSRFARNTVDSLTTIRKLKEHHVECYFEKENIWTFDEKCEILLTVLSSLAQEESRSISENCTWGQRKRFQDGKVSVPFGRFLGYDRGENGELVVNEEQAKIVRYIYGLYLKGYNSTAIARILTDDGIPTPGGKTKWQDGVVRYILSNEKYKGDALLQKVYTVSFLTKEKRKNTGQVPQYYVEGDHEAIIDPATFDLVQSMIADDREKKRQYAWKGTFAGKIVCGCCGGFYGPKVWHSNDKYRTYIWRCNNKYKRKGEKCSSPSFREDYLKELFVRAYNEIFKDKNSIIRDFEEIEEVVFNTSELEAEQSRLQIEINDIAKAVENCIALNAHVAQNQEEYRQHYDSLVKKYETVSEELQKVSTEIQLRKVRHTLTDHFLSELKKQKETITEFSQDLLYSMVEEIRIYSKERIVFKFKNGYEIEMK